MSKESMSYFRTNDEDTGVSFDEFVCALGVWSYMHAGDQPTVREAGDTFNVTDQVVISALKAHPWLFLAGQETDDPTTLKIDLDGE